MFFFLSFLTSECSFDCDAKKFKLMLYDNILLFSALKLFIVREDNIYLGYKKLSKIPEDPSLCTLCDL